MKRLTTLWFLALMMIVPLQAITQTISVKAGINLSKMLLESDSIDINSNDIKMITGFHVGATMEVPLNKVFLFETGLLLSTKGYKYSNEQSFTDPTFGTFAMTVKQNVTLYYIDIPITVKAQHKFGEVTVSGGAGPYVGLGLSGKNKYETKITFFGLSNTDSGKEDVKWGSDPDNDLLKRFDMGLTANAGVEIKSVLFGISYGLGMLNLAPSSSVGKTKNRVFSVTVGYKIGKK